MNRKKGNLSSNYQTNLPPIPHKLYLAIGEVAKLCDLQQHVIRYWEQEFPQLSPLKRRGNRRYYQRKDVLLIRRIRSLLYDQGYTIAGARHQLAVDHQSQDANATLAVDKTKMQGTMQRVLVGLEEVLAELSSA